MSIRRAFLAFGSAAALLAAPEAGAAQEPAAAAPAPTLGELMRALRATRAERWQREEAIGALVDHHGAGGAEQAARYLAGKVAAEGERWDKAAARYLAEFAKRAPRAVLAASEKESAEEIERLRAEALAVSAREDLAKEHIVEQVDPRLARLGELLLLEPSQALERDTALAEQRDALMAGLDELRDWWDLWRLAATAWMRLDPERAGEGAGARRPPPSDPAPRQDALEEQEEWLCLLATPMSARDRETLERNRASRAEIRPEEYAGILEHNRIRIRLGLHAQRVDPKLCAAGRDHSTDMKTLGFFAHESPVEGKKTPGDRAARFGTSAGAENIAWGQASPHEAVMAWWHSPGHHKNMLGGAERIGLGHFETYWTEMFG